MAALPLRRHQRELLDGVLHALEIPFGGAIPESGLRATLVSATGTGKTRIAAEVVRRLAPHGRVLVMVPTLDLLTQTVEAWRTAGHTGPAIALCSLYGDEVLSELDVRCTTSAPRLALWGSAGPVTVFATYAALTSRPDDDGELGPGPLEEAMAGVYGQQLAPFDLAIVDEAHRTSGAWAKSWAAIHDQTRIPATRRLYLTATPRLWALPNTGGETADATDGRGQGGAAGTPGNAAASGELERLVASMDDEELYGLHIEFGLMEAIERGILASFEIDVLEIRDPGLDGEEALSLEEARGRRLGALQAALLAYAEDSDARSLITFHHRTREAMVFARGLSATAAELHEAEPRRYPKPSGVWADWLCGEHEPAHRRAVLRQFADGVDADGWVTEVGILSSCKVLGEGVDVVGQRGVDGVVFADTRGSVVDIVQNVGRALRQAPGEGKVARLIVPVFLAPDDWPGEMMVSPSFRGLAAVLQGLRAHDERVIERLILRQEHSGRGAAEDVVTDDPAYERVYGDRGAAGSQAGGEAKEGVGQAEAAGGPLLWISSERDPREVVRFLRTRVLQPDSEVWLRGYGHLCRWVEEHGSAQVPVEACVPTGDGGDGGDGEETYPLGQWCAEQRRAHRAGALRPWRFQLLDELGLDWDVNDARFVEKLAVFRRYFAEYGSLAAPIDAVYEGHPVGQDLANLRKPAGLGKKPERAVERRRQLEAIDPGWNPGWSVAWQRRWAKVRRCVEDGAWGAELLPGVVVDGDDLGVWLAEQQAAWGTLSVGQRERLEQLGMQPPEAVSGGCTAALEGQDGAVVVLAEASAWERGMAALRQFQAREGHVRVPRKHRETIRIDHGTDGGVVEEHLGLGVFRSNTRSRRDRLTAQQRAEAEQLGLLA